MCDMSPLMQDPSGEREADSTGKIYVDGHVHIYPEYDLGAFFRRGLQVAAKAGGPLLMLLVESYGHDYFKALTELSRGAATSGRVSSAALPGIEIRPTSEAWSLAIPAACEGDAALFLIAGRQLVSSENLEVLVIGLSPDHPAAAVPAGERSAVELIRGGLDAGAIAVLPWGFGKWLGARGRIVEALCCRDELRDHPLFFAGDILARCRPWPRPGAVRQARVLPGTDILPLPGYEARLARYGFRVEGPFDWSTPCRSLMELLRRRLPIEIVGSRASLPATLIDQIRYRLRSR